MHLREVLMAHDTYAPVLLSVDQYSFIENNVA